MNKTLSLCEHVICDAFENLVISVSNNLIYLLFRLKIAQN